MIWEGFALIGRFQAPRQTPPRPVNEIPLPAKMLACLGASFCFNLYPIISNYRFIGTNSKFRIVEDFMKSIITAGSEANTAKPVISPAVSGIVIRLPFPLILFY